MLNLTRPRTCSRSTATTSGCACTPSSPSRSASTAERIHKGRNGLPLEIDADGARFGEPIEAGMIFVDGVDIGDPDDVALRDRRMLSADGIFIVVATVDSEDGTLGGAAGDHLPRRPVPRGRRGGGLTRGAARRGRGLARARSPRRG